MKPFGIVFSHTVRRLPGFQWIIAVPNWIKIILTFHIVTLAWVFFRAPDMQTAVRIFSGPFTGGWDNLGETASAFMFPILLMVVFSATHAIDGHARVRWLLGRLPAVVVWPVFIALWALAITISAGSSAKFIYFDF